MIGAAAAVVLAIAKPFVDEIFLKTPAVTDTGAGEVAFLGHFIDGLLVEAEVIGKFANGHDGWSRVRQNITVRSRKLDRGLSEIVILIKSV